MPNWERSLEVLVVTTLIVWLLQNFDNFNFYFLRKPLDLWWVFWECGLNASLFGLALSLLWLWLLLLIFFNHSIQFVHCLTWHLNFWPLWSLVIILYFISNIHQNFFSFVVRSQLHQCQGSFSCSKRFYCHEIVCFGFDHYHWRHFESHWRS